MTPELAGESVGALRPRRERHWLSAPIVEPAAAAWIALAGLLVCTGGFLFYIARGTTFWFDEWVWIAYRRGDGVGTFLRSYNGHFSLIPIAIYKVLFATVGLANYGPYRAVALVVHLVCGTLVFVYARRRVGAFLALCAAALILLLGAGWQDIIWPFQVAWLISVAAGLGCLLMLDRQDRAGDVGAACLLASSLASSGVGIVFALGVAAELLLSRRRWREAWILAVPVALYGVWWLAYQQSTPLAPIRLVPRFVANSAAAEVAGLVGVTAPRPATTTLSAGDLLAWGRPLAAIAVTLVIWRLIRLRRISPRLASILTIAVSFWVLTALTRASAFGGSQAWASRYLYVGGVLLVLLAVELLSGVAIGRAVKLLIGAAAVLAVALNTINFRNAAYDMRTFARATRADLGAVQIGRPLASADYVLRWLPGSPFIDIHAGAYFAAANAVGTPASTPAQIAADPVAARQTADRELIRIHAIAPQPATEAPRLGPRPPVASTVGAAAGRGACVVLRAVGSAGHASLVVRSPSLHLLITATGGTAALAVRRFAPSFEFVGTVPPSRPETVRIAPDLSTQPWELRVAPSARVSVCGLR